MTDRDHLQPVIEAGAMVWLVRLVTQDLLAATASGGGDISRDIVDGALGDALEAEGRALWEDT